MPRPVVGIDLGTSNSVIAVVDGDRAIVIPDRQGRRIHPSVVSFHPKGTVLVGHEAKRRRIIDPMNTVYSAKRLIGRTFRSTEVQAAMQRVPYKIVEGENQQPKIIVRKREYVIPQISAFVLRYVKKLAEEYTGETITDAVVTVPANFDDGQREATRAAGEIAGLNVLRILNEPTAAALAYGYGQGMQTCVAIYDFGGGTFDITILRLDDCVFEVLSTAGNTFLGGDDIDHVICEHMTTLFVQQTGIDLRFNMSALSRLYAVAEQVKCQLSSRSKAVVQVQEIAYGQGGEPLDLSFTLTVEELNAMSRNILGQSFLICDEAMRLANMTTTHIDGIVLVGGTTRMPLVRRGVAQYFGKEPNADINPDEVVAVGAAIQAIALAQGASTSTTTTGTPAANTVLLDVTPRALGIATVGGFSEAIIDRNAQIPIEQTRRFVTSQDYQTCVRIQVCQGESRLFDENQPLGELVLENLPGALRGEVKIDVTFEIDTNGILQVQARDALTGRAQRAHVQIHGGLSTEQITQMAAHQNELPMVMSEED